MTWGYSSTKDTTQGPKRWERARLNAEKHPQSKAAKLYQKRVTLASAVVDMAWDDLTGQPWTLSHGDSSNRREYCCSMYCMTLRLQLHMKDALPADRYLELFAHAAQGATAQLHSDVPYWNDSLTALTATKTVRCRVCDQEIKPDGVVVKEIVKATAAVEKKKQYVYLDGKLVPVGLLVVVDLSDDQHRLLSEYSTDGLRQKYAIDHGHPFSS